MTPEEFLKLVAQAYENEDLEKMRQLADHFIDGGRPSLPFQPDLRLQGQELASEEEGQVAMAAANAWSRALRKLEYNHKIRSGYSGPIVVSEGDSWFQYPVLLEDVIDNLSDVFAVLSLGAAGDTLANMSQHREYRSAIEENNADVFLFSAAGNDVLGGGNLATLLNPFSPGMEVGDVVKQDVVRDTLQNIEKSYEDVIRDALSVKPSLRIFFHGYDRPLPRRGGKWLGGPMERLDIPPSLQPAITGFLIDELNTCLARLELRFSNRATHVDCRGRVGSSAQSWYDELHPRNPGYSRVAALFEARISAAEEITRPVHVLPHAMGEIAPEPVTPTDMAWQRADEEAITDVTQPLPSELGGVTGAQLSPLDREILADVNELRLQERMPDQDKRLRARRHLVPDDDENAFERILGDSNLFPVNFLSRGAKRSRAVAKIQLFLRGEIPSGSGSGFLVGPGLLLTNNHVIGSREAARRARAVFDFQDDDDFMPMPTKIFNITDDIFFTSDRQELDFTFVSVRLDNNAGHQLSDFGSFTLVEESGKAVKGEPVSIIQHPGGRNKSIALRDSTILGIKGDFIYYSTDTEPGTSGAPVLNDQWLPVALHHRSVPHPTIPDKWIANRGVRISQIYRTLRSAAENGDTSAARVLRLIGAETQKPPTPVPTLHRVLRKRETDFIPGVADIAAGEILHSEETFSPDRWDNVGGYDPDFLSVSAPLPLPPGGSNVLEVNNRPDLPYHHFSVVMHANRRLAMVTACNSDGAKLQRLGRSGSWRLDPRIPREAHVDNRAYSANQYDRGHLVRRLTPMWGTRSEARKAQADTFHYTVCAPQHARLNQKVWLELENYILDWAEQHAARVSIFSGPLFRADDPLYRGIVKVPADYWKIAVADESSGPRAVGYLHSQKNLIATVEEAFGEYKTHRVPIHVIEELSGLDFSALGAIDVAAGGFEAAEGARPVMGPEDIGL